MNLQIRSFLKTNQENDMENTEEPRGGQRAQVAGDITLLHLLVTSVDKFNNLIHKSYQ